jgi:hypothetical protein
MLPCVLTSRRSFAHSSLPACRPLSSSGVCLSSRPLPSAPLRSLPSSSTPLPTVASHTEVQSPPQGARHGNAPDGALAHGAPGPAPRCVHYCCSPFRFPTPQRRRWSTKPSQRQSHAHAHARNRTHIYNTRTYATGLLQDHHIEEAHELHDEHSASDLPFTRKEVKRVASWSKAPTAAAVHSNELEQKGDNGKERGQ